MQIGEPVVLLKHSPSPAGQKYAEMRFIEIDAIVIGSRGEEINVAFFDESKQEVLSGVDWRLAFERVNDVKHFSHDDVQAGREGFAYRLFSETQARENEYRFALSKGDESEKSEAPAKAKGK